MERQTAHDFDQELLDLFDGYVHGIIERREFLERKDRERKRLRESDREFFTNPPRDTVNAMGKPFVRVVLSNYYQDRLTLSDVSRYLGLRVKHMSRLEQFVGFG